MKYCPNCGKRLKSSATACSRCGASFERILYTLPSDNKQCPNCSAICESDADICENCDHVFTKFSVREILSGSVPIPRNKRRFISEFFGIVIFPFFFLSIYSRWIEGNLDKTYFLFTVLPAILLVVGLYVPRKNPLPPLAMLLFAFRYLSALYFYIEMDSFLVTDLLFLLAFLAHILCALLYVVNLKMFAKTWFVAIIMQGIYAIGNSVLASNSLVQFYEAFNDPCVERIVEIVIDNICTTFILAVVAYLARIQMGKRFFAA